MVGQSVLAAPAALTFTNFGSIPASAPDFDQKTGIVRQVRSPSSRPSKASGQSFEYRIRGVSCARRRFGCPARPINQSSALPRSASGPIPATRRQRFRAARATIANRASRPALRLQRRLSACVPRRRRRLEGQPSRSRYGNILFQTKFKAGRINSTARYFVRFRLEVSQNDKVVFEHDYNAENQDVLIRFPVDTLGDVLGWFPCAVKFKERHNCRLTCAMEARLIALFRDAYPDITFITHEQVQPERFYADLTGSFCTKRIDRNWLGKELCHAEEEV